MTVYDELPYDSLPVPGTSPRRLALCSLLHGGPRPPLEGFRVLELGCNDGHNLLPMAFYAPDSTFLGVDNATTALTAGRAAARAVGVSNLRLEPMDLAAPDALEGEFDYVLIHGVFSWVDADVRRRILEVCARHVAPDGVVYLSHNVDAGWRIRGLVRDVMMDAVRGVATAAGRNSRAREVATELAGIVDESELAYHVLLTEELRRVAGSTESYLAHETLSAENVALRHDGVVAMLAEYGFSYLADALYDCDEGRIPESLDAALRAVTDDAAAREQLADVLGYRRFRSSVFCRADARTDDPDGRAVAALGELYATNRSAESDDEDDEPAGDDLTPAQEAQAAAARLLLAREWPSALRVSEVVERSRELCGAPADDDALLRRSLLRMHVRGSIALHAVAPPVPPPAGEGVPHRLARYEAATGRDLTTPLHELIGLEPLDRVMVRLLGEGRGVDGTTAEVGRLAAAGEIELRGDDDEAPDVRAAVAACLDTLGRFGLLA